MLLEELKTQVQEKFPLIAAAADRRHERYWDNDPPEGAYSWFESLANALKTRCSDAYTRPFTCH